MSGFCEYLMTDRRRRVLVFNHFAMPRGQAGGTRHVELFGRLDGWDYLIIASDLNPQTGKRLESEQGLAVVPVPSYSSNGSRRILNWVAYAGRATVLGMKQRDVDVVYGSTPQLLAPLAAWAVAEVRRVPFVLEIRDLWPQVLVDMGTLSTSSPAFRALTTLETFLYARAQRIVVMAEGSRDTLVARGIPLNKIIYIPNGADAADFEPSAARDQLRERYGFKQFTAVYAGAHGPANGLGLLLDAAKAVRDLPLEIVLVGGGIEKSNLRAQAGRMQLDNVRFMDPVPKEDIPDLLHAADLGLHVLADVELFRTAVSPNKVFDYMAAGLPVLTNCPGLTSELVEAAACGVAVAPTGIAEGLRAAMKGDFEGSGQRGADWLAANQSRGSMSERLSRVLTDVTQTRNWHL